MAIVIGVLHDVKESQRWKNVPTDRRSPEDPQARGSFYRHSSPGVDQPLRCRRPICLSLAPVGSVFSSSHLGSYLLQRPPPISVSRYRDLDLLLEQVTREINAANEQAEAMAKRREKITSYSHQDNQTKTQNKPSSLFIVNTAELSSSCSFAYRLKQFERGFTVRPSRPPGGWSSLRDPPARHRG